MVARKREKRFRARMGQSPKRRSNDARRSSHGDLSEPAVRHDSIATIKSAAGLILAVTENRNWIEVFFEGNMMHTRTVNLPAGRMFDMYMEEIPHKTTVYEHPRTMILFDGPCDLDITCDGDKIVVSGQSIHADKN